MTENETKKSDIHLISPHHIFIMNLIVIYFFSQIFLQSRTYLHLNDIIDTPQIYLQSVGF